MCDVSVFKVLLLFVDFSYTLIQQNYCLFKDFYQNPQEKVKEAAPLDVLLKEALVEEEVVEVAVEDLLAEEEEEEALAGVVVEDLEVVEIIVDSIEIISVVDVADTEQK